MYNEIDVQTYGSDMIDVIYYADGEPIKRKTRIKMGGLGYSMGLDIYVNGIWARVSTELYEDV